MSTGYTCAQCLQVLRHGVGSGSGIRVSHIPRFQSLPIRRAIPFTRSFGTERKSYAGPSIAAKNQNQSQHKHSHLNHSGPCNSAAPTGRSAASTSTGPSVDTRAILKPDNLFHSFTNSPSPQIRQRASFIKQNAFCPHPDHAATRAPVSPNDPEARKSAPGSAEQSQPPAHSHFECPDCGVPVYCSEGHWMDDFEAHLEICETLRQINEDDHDLQSGRVFSEFNYPGVQDDNFVINMTNWDTLMYTREFDAVNDDRAMRQVTRMLTYPQTIASVLHELSPHSVRGKGGLTAEGLKSVSGMHSPKNYNCVCVFAEG